MTDDLTSSKKIFYFKPHKQQLNFFQYTELQSNYNSKGRSHIIAIFSNLLNIATYAKIHPAILLQLLLLLLFNQMKAVDQI